MDAPELSIVGPGPGLQEAVRQAQTPYVAVLARPDPELAEALLSKAKETDADIAVAADPNPGILRRTVATATRLAVPQARSLTDPWSGAFLVRKGTDLKGPAPLLSALRPGVTTVELQAAHERPSRPWPATLLQLLALSFKHPENQRMLRFGFVGLTGAVVNLAILALLHERVKLHDLLAVPIAIEASIVWNHFWNDRLTFHDRRRSHYMMRLLRFNTVSLVALAANFTAYATLTRAFGLHYLAAEAIAIVVAFGLNYVGNFHWTYGADKPRVRPLARRALPWLPFVAVVAAAGGMYLHDIDEPPGLVFDEHYYVSVAYQLDQGTWEDPCWIGQEIDRRPLNYEHPPLAKLIMGASVAAFGESGATLEGCRAPDDNPGPYDAFQAQLEKEPEWVYRAPSAVFGIMAVAFVGLAAGRLAGPLAAFAGALLTLADGTVFTASRLATLDIFAAGFLAVAVFFATFPSNRGLSASMVALGLGFSCKYSVAFAGPAVLALALWVHARAGRLSWRLTWRSAVGYGATAIGVWMATYTPWLVMWIRDAGPRYAFRHLYALTREAFGWQAVGQQEHAYASPPGEWLMLARPTVYYHNHAVGGDEEVRRYIYSIGNPALYWMAVAAFVFAWLPALWGTVRPGGQKGDLRRWWDGLGHGGQAVAVASLLPAATYGGFFLITRTTFAFYMTLVAPMMAVAVATAMGVAWRRRSDAWWVFPGLVLATSWFLHMLPVLQGQEISADHWDRITGAWPWWRP